MSARRLQRNVTERARLTAGDAGFGVWERSLRVNEHLDKDGLLTGATLLFVAPWPYFGLLLFLPMPWWSQALCGATGIMFFCWGLVQFPKACRRWWSGQALAHLFEEGAVLERTRGRIFALPYSSTAVEYMTWAERIPDSDGDRPRTHLWITLPDGQIAMLDAWGKQELQDLEFIARRCGLPAAPRALEKEPLPTPQLW